MPLNNNLLSIKVWDKDLLSPNDFISEATIDFSREAKLAYSVLIFILILIFRT